jgi:hypothetical protein
MDMTFFAVVWLFSIVIAGCIGVMKERTAFGILLGFLLGFVGVLIILCFPSAKAPGPRMLPCPYCRGLIHPEASVCQHCHSTTLGPPLRVLPPGSGPG